MGCDVPHGCWDSGCFHDCKIKNVYHARSLVTTKDMIDDRAEAAADLLEQLDFDVSNCSLTALQAVLWGMRMNLGTIIPGSKDDKIARDKLLSSLGGWRKAFVTSRRNREELCVSVARLCATIKSKRELMVLIKKLAKPATIHRLALFKKEAMKIDLLRKSQGY